MRLSGMAIFLLTLASGAVQAGEVALLGCRGGEYQQEFWVGTGRQLKGQGLSFEVFYCPGERTMKAYTVVKDPVSYGRLTQLADMPDSDTTTLAARFADVNSQTTQFRDLFPDVGELTFGDIRNTVRYVARPLSTTIEGSSFVSYVHPLCDEPLVPAEYYIQTQKPFPLCSVDGTLKRVMRSSPDPLWD